MAPRRTRTKLIVGLAVVAIGSLAFGTFSPESATGIVTSVTIAPKFQGVVNAAAPCQAGREVVLKKKRRPGKRPRNKIIGTDISDGNGRWEVPTNRQFGRYFAVARERPNPGGVGGYGYSNPTVCEKGKSPILNLGSRPRQGRPRRR